eukprot:1158947-Pelagomonas_calceolata.AAC.10
MKQSASVHSKESRNNRSLGALGVASGQTARTLKKMDAAVAHRLYKNGVTHEGACMWTLPLEGDGAT